MNGRFGVSIDKFCTHREWPVPAHFNRNARCREIPFGSFLAPSLMRVIRTACHRHISNLSRVEVRVVVVGSASELGELVTRNI